MTGNVINPKSRVVMSGYADVFELGKLRVLNWKPAVDMPEVYKRLTAYLPEQESPDGNS